MSYIRCSHVMRYVKGLSKDYIFLSHNCNCKTVLCPKHPLVIEDYGKISNESIIEILATRFLADDSTFRNYIIPILSKRLKVKLRKKTLTIDEYIRLDSKQHDRFMRKFTKKSPDLCLK